MIKIDGRKLDHGTLENYRKLAIKRVMEGGEKPSAVAASLGLCRTSVYPWIRAYNKKGAQGIASRKACGPKPKLTEAHCERVKKWIIGKDPRQFGLEFGLWTRQIVAQPILEKMGIRVGLTAVGRMLARLEITPQKPLRRAYERSPEAVSAWLDKDYPKLKRRARRNGAEIFFLDEAGFSSEPALGRTYGLKGKTPEVRTTGQRQKVNAISALSARGAFWSNVYTGNFNAARFIAFLKDFRRGRTRKKIYMVVDGHPSHHAKVVRKYIRECKGKLELHFLPPYAPDLNPDEFVWQHAKRNGLAKKPLKKNESLRERVEQDLRNIKKNKSLVRSFFYAPSVAYAKD